MKNRYVHLTARLECALSLISKTDVIADIGCDHGRFSIALLQRGLCRKVIATDISEASLEKARMLAGYIGLKDIDFRVGNGLEVLQDDECNVLTLLGMGGTLMARILDSSKIPLKGAESVVLQPMRAQSDIRSYLFEHNYHITHDRIVSEKGRLYQILRAIPCTEKQSLPEQWPSDFFDVGFVAYVNRDPLLTELIDQQLRQHTVRLKEADGTEGEQVLKRKIECLLKIRTLITEKEELHETE